jgi:polysaccharide biosynthesis protein PslH
MSKKILIISPTPTHPANAGNRARILNMASFLISAGHEVHFLYSRQERADEEAMRKFWGDRFHMVDYKKPELSVSRKRTRLILQRFSLHYRYYCHVDEHYNLLLDAEIKKLDSRFHFEAVLVEYIFQSKAFLNFNPKVLRVIDTHDVMTDRHKLFLKEGKQPVWYSTLYRQEKKGIRRADVVIAIQEKEKDHFAGMTPKPVFNVGHIVRIGKYISEFPRKKLLFVGSDNPSNLYGIKDLLEKDLPVVRKEFPDLELLVAGNVCGRIENIPEGVRLLGELEDISLAYDLSDLVINPLTIGTGLKIKMIEAMGLSKVVFSTPVGAEGLEDGAGKGYLLYRNSQELVNGLKDIFTRLERYTDICKNAADIAEQWNRNNCSWLEKIFSDSSVAGHE